MHTGSSRRDFLQALGLTAAALALPQELLAEVAASPTPPNILLILADDLGYADLSCQGCKDVSTPNIDSIAKNGIRFTNAYVSCPLCSPVSGAGLMTGRYQQRFGWETNPQRGDPGLPVEEKTMADYFKAAGYATAIVGKWHLGYAQPFLPLQRGFGEYFGFTYAMNPYGGGTGDGKPVMVFRGNEQVEEKEYLTDAFTREALDFITRQKKAQKPFFLYLPYNAVHAPLDFAPRYKDKFAEITDDKRRKFATMLTALDDAVGIVLKKIRDENLEENTLIIFLSDNGGAPKINASLNTPFSGGKNSVAEGGIRIPWMMQWKGRITPGAVSDMPIISLDILPTCLSAAKIKHPNPNPLEGINLLPFLDAKKVSWPHDYLYWRIGPQWAIRGGDYKLRGNTAHPDGELFDLAADPAEQNNLSDRFPDKVKELKAAYDQWNTKNKPSIMKMPANRADLPE